MTLMKSACLVLAFAGCLALPHVADAVIVPHRTVATAPAHCQAFTPGPANTIRNRVVGSENVGSAPMNVACTFEKAGTMGQGRVDLVTLYFSNNGTETITVNCTLLTGYQGMSGAVMLNKTANVVPGFQNAIYFSASDTADPSDETLGSEFVGVNCTLPPHGGINDTYVQWLEDSGVGN